VGDRERGWVGGGLTGSEDGFGDPGFRGQVASDGRGGRFPVEASGFRDIIIVCRRQGGVQKPIQPA
jgi:hypothetical protein